MKKRSLQLLLLLVATIICLVIVIFWDTKKETQNRVQIGKSVFSVEIVRTPAEMQKGLGERDSLCADCGMLFVFDGAGRRSFWMKGMRFPLDILWIKDGEIVHLQKNISAQSKETFSPEAQADMVLEINAGMSDKKGIEVGDSVDVLWDNKK